MSVEKPGPPPFWSPFLPHFWTTSEPFNFLGENKKSYNLKQNTICVLHTCTTSSFTLKFPSIQHSAQKRRCCPSQNTFPSFFFGISKGDQECSGNQLFYNFGKTCHIQVAWIHTILFSSSLVFSLTCFNKW